MGDQPYPNGHWAQGLLLWCKREDLNNEIFNYHLDLTAKLLLKFCLQGAELKKSKIKYEINSCKQNQWTPVNVPQFRLEFRVILTLAFIIIIYNTRKITSLNQRHAQSAMQKEMFWRWQQSWGNIAEERWLHGKDSKDKDHEHGNFRSHKHSLITMPWSWRRIIHLIYKHPLHQKRFFATRRSGSFWSGICHRILVGRAEGL